MHVFSLWEKILDKSGETMRVKEYTFFKKVNKLVLGKGA